MNLENELRGALRAKAAAFAPSPQPRDSVVRRARMRVFRRMSATMLMIAAAALAGTNLTSRVTPGQRAFAAFTVREKPSAHSDNTPSPHADDVPSHEHVEPGKPITLSTLKKNTQCMRDHGFNLPDPVATAQGWQVIVEDSSPLPSESPDYNVRKRWAQAVFVDCRLMAATGDLVLGGRTREQIGSLIKCARARGFVLPAPSESRPGEFVFDLDATSPHWGSEAWYRTVFVTCGLWRFGPDRPS